MSSGVELVLYLLVPSLLLTYYFGQSIHELRDDQYEYQGVCHMTVLTPGTHQSPPLIKMSVISCSSDTCCPSNCSVNLEGVFTPSWKYMRLMKTVSEIEDDNITTIVRNITPTYDCNYNKSNIQATLTYGIKHTTINMPIGFGIFSLISFILLIVLIAV